MPSWISLQCGWQAAAASTVIVALCPLYACRLSMKVPAALAVRWLPLICRLVRLRLLLVTIQARSRRLRAHDRARHILFTRRSFESTIKLACLFSVLSRNPNADTALYTRRPNFADKCHAVRQGQWCCAGHRHPEGTMGYTTT